MGVIKYVGKKVGNRVNNLGKGVSALVGGVTAWQFPQFLAQYLQRLGGHIDEGRIIAEQYNVPEVLERASDLEAGLLAITDAGTLGKLVAFIEHMEPTIMQNTLDRFKAGVTFDIDGLVYAALGAYVASEAFDATKATVVAGTKLAGRGAYGLGRLGCNQVSKLAGYVKNKMLAGKDNYAVNDNLV